MIDLKLVQKQPEVLAKALADRHSELDVNEFLGLDARRRALLAEVEALKSQRNTASGQVAALKREGKDAGSLLAELGGLSDRIKELDGQTAQAKADVEAWLMRVPNIPDASVPVGRDETENVEVTRWGTPRRFDFPVREHGDLGVALGGLDFERAARLTGSRFVVSLGWAARLDRALVNFFLDQHTRHENYIEVCPPYMVNRATMTGTGQLPKFEEDLFKLREWDYYLIPTAEVPLTNLHAGEVLRLLRGHALLPLRGGQRGQGHARDHPHAPVHQGRDGPFRPSGRQLQPVGADVRPCPASAGIVGAALSGDHALHRRHGLRFGQDL